MVRPASAGNPSVAAYSKVALIPWRNNAFLNGNRNWIICPNSQRTPELVVEWPPFAFEGSQIELEVLSIALPFVLRAPFSFLAIHQAIAPSRLTIREDFRGLLVELDPVVGYPLTSLYREEVRVNCESVRLHAGHRWPPFQLARPLFAILVWFDHATRRQPALEIRLDTPLAILFPSQTAILAFHSSR